MTKEHAQPTVLIIDDDKSMCGILTEMLEREGVVARSAQNGLMGLSEAFKLHPDVIVLDYMMPEMNGGEVLRTLRADKWGANAKVMMLTGSTDPSVLPDVMEHGANIEFLLKPDWSLDALVARIKERADGAA